MGVLAEPPGLPLWSEYPRFVLRHWARIGTLAAVGLLLGLGWSSLQPSIYSATASVALAPVPKYALPSTSGLAPPQVSIDTDARLLHSPEVTSAVGRALGTRPDAAMDHLGVTASPNSDVLHVTVSSSSPRRAAAAANAAAEALEQVRRDSLGALRIDQLRLLRLWVGGQEDLLAQEQRRRVIVAASDDVLAELIEMRSGLQELEEARLAPLEVLSPALPPPRPDYPNTEVPLTSGAMAGLLAGCLWGARHDRRQITPPHSSPRTDPVPAGFSSAALIPV